jgi:hypothetical protein
MNARRVLYLTSVVLAMCTAARPAEANMSAFFDYLFALSGPGPFRGASYTADVVCIGHPLIAAGTLDSDPVHTQGSDGPKATGPGGCYVLDRNKAQTRVSMSVGLLTTTESHYTYSPPRPTTRVDAIPFTAALDTNLFPTSKDADWIRRHFRWGAGAGRIFFVGPGFTPFSVYEFELPRVAIVFPLGKVVEFEARSVTKWFGGVSANEFGAV